MQHPARRELKKVIPSARATLPAETRQVKLPPETTRINSYKWSFKFSKETVKSELAQGN